jgi:hypothetical protein
MTNFLQKILFLFHVSLFFIITIGPFLPGKYLIYYLFLWPAIYFHWHFNDNNCMLTEIEYKMDINHHNGIEQYRFYSLSNLISVLYKKFNIYISDIDSLNKWTDYYSSILWTIAFIRLLICYRKDIKKWWILHKKQFTIRFLCDTLKR